MTAYGEDEHFAPPPSGIGDEIPLLLVKERASNADLSLEGTDDYEERLLKKANKRVANGDRMRPGSAGALMGLVGGAAGLGLVHYLLPGLVVPFVARSAALRGVTFEVALGVAYATVAASGGIVGALFAAVTKYLRRFLPLLLWSLVFFGSVALLVLAVVRGAPPALPPVVLGATALYAVLLALSLPLRKRS